MLRLCRPLRGSCSLLWKSGQSGKTPSWRQAFTGPCGQDQSSQTAAHSNSRESSALLQCSYWQITDGNFVFILLRLKFIHQLHHRAPEKHTWIKEPAVSKEEEAEEEELPWAQKLHHSGVFMRTRAQEPQVPASHDTVQTSKHTLHQPGEDGVELLGEQKHPWSHWRDTQHQPTRPRLG